MQQPIGVDGFFGTRKAKTVIKLLWSRFFIFQTNIREGLKSIAVESYFVSRPNLIRIVKISTHVYNLYPKLNM